MNQPTSAVLRSSSLLLAAALLFTGCKDTQTPSTGAPVVQEPGGNASGAPVAEARPEETNTPVTATAGEPAGEPAGETKPPPPDSTFTECTTRSKMCTREYQPVCGKLSDGSRKTFGNKCVACSDQAVLGYSAGPCEPPQTPPM